VRIAYILTRSDLLGGAQVHVRDLATAMSVAGHRVTVFGGGRGVLARHLADAGVEFVEIPSLKRAPSPWDELRAYGQLREALAACAPELVSTHSSKAGAIGRLAARKVGIPAIFTAHGWAFTEGVGAARLLYTTIERGLAPLSAKIITVSEYDRRLALAAGVATADRVVAIHNGMPERATPVAAPAEGPPRLVMVARFHRQKDHATLLRALAGLTDLPWRLDLEGEGPLEDDVKRFAGELGLSDRVSFLGLREDVADILGGAQLYLLVSRWEGFPRSILEGMRAGLPIVASDVGGVREAVDADVGRVVPSGNAPALAEALRPLLADGALRARLGAEARRRFLERFTFDRMARSTEAVYREVLAATPAHRS
jgi:glycosyltransferase involved in cell wall biosynthesis